MKKFLLPTAMVAVLLSMPLVVSCSNSSDNVSDYLAISSYTSYTKYPTPSAPTITVEKSEWTNGIKIKVVPGDNWSKCKFYTKLVYTDTYVYNGGFDWDKEDNETVIFKGKSEVITFEVRLDYYIYTKGSVSRRTTISYYSDPYNFTYTPLTAPTGVTATKVDSSKAQISWNSTKAQSYKIYGGSDSNFESATLLATVEKDKTTCEVSNSFSYYWVQAYQSARTLYGSTSYTYLNDSATSDPVHYTES